MISFDYETKGEPDLRKVGLDAYTAHPSFGVLMMAYRIDNGPLKHWEAHKEPFPAEVKERLLDPHEKKWAFNAQFERISTLRGLGIDTPVEGWRCSMALAYMRSFMGGLADIGEQMLIPADMTKKKMGTKLIRQFCMPQRLTKNQPHLWRDWETDPHDWSLFCEYNLGDVVAEEAVRDRVLPYPMLEDEWLFYALDQRINDRGMPLDRVFAENVARMSERRREELLAQMRERTGLDNPGSQVQLLRWLNTQGYEFDDIGEHTVARALTLHSAGLQGLTDIGVEVLRLRQWAARAATKKAQAALRSAGSDDRIRYMFQFGGASRTARFCIAEGSLVLVRDQQRRIYNLPIERVTLVHDVWDGDAWVAHDGSYFSGIKSVILYDGIVATPEHIVYTTDLLRLPLGEAARLGLRLWRGSCDDYAAYNLSGDFAIGSLLCRDDPFVVEGAVEASSTRGAQTGEDGQASTVFGDQEVWRGELHAGSAGALCVFRGCAGSRDTSNCRASAEGTALQCVAGGRGYQVGARSIEGTDDGPGLVCRIPCAVVGGDQKQSSGAGERCCVWGADEDLARAEPGESVGTESESTQSSRSLAPTEPGEIPRDEISYFQRVARAKPRESTRSGSGCWRANQTEVVEYVARGEGEAFREKASERDAAMGGVYREGQEEAQQEDCQIVENPQRREDFRTACCRGGSVGKSSREYRSFLPETTAEGSVESLLDARAPGSRFRSTQRSTCVQPQGAVRTYDIINAGPKNRFLVSGRIVSNSGRLVQPQNMARTPKMFDPEHSTDRLDTVTDLIRAGNYDAFNLVVDEPMMVFGGTMRGMFRAREGHRLHVCDYSSIESVGLAWVSGCDRMLQVFRDGRDFYRDFGTDLYKKTYAEITSAERQICKSSCLGCGYGLGPGKVLDDGTMTGLLAYAANMGIRMSLYEAQSAVAAYRETYDEVPLFWRKCDNAAASVLDNGQPVAVGPLLFEWRKPFLLIRLPSGRSIYYYKPRMEWREVGTGRKSWDEKKMMMVEETYMKHVLTFMGRNQRNARWDRIAGRGAHLTENCIAEGTEVLTDHGWVAIENVGADALVWDGVEFVSHDGVVCQGRKETICVGGVWMTPDHKVLTDGGFVDAGGFEGTPASVGFDGDAVWSAYGNRVRGRRRWQVVVARALRLWGREATKSGVPEKKVAFNPLVRVLKRWFARLNTRYDGYADLCGVAFYAGSVSLAYPSRVSAVWRQGNYSLRGMVGFRAILSRYGKYISAWTNDRTDRQQQRVLFRELQMGYAASTEPQQAKQCYGRNSQRSYAPLRGRRYQRHWEDNSFVSRQEWVAGRADVRSTKCNKSCLVYDVLNAGFRHRFTVRGAGRPFIVSNCVQALTRDILKVGLMRLDEAGFGIIGHSHDEVIVESREGDNSRTWERMREIMIQPIDWLPNFPLNAAGWSGQYYRK